MAVTALRQGDFLALGGRVYGLSADTPEQNSAVMEKMGVRFPIFSDVDREAAIRPLGFDDERDPRKISLPGVVIISPEGEIVYRFVGRDYADRPDEDELLERLAALGLPATSQERVSPGPAEPGPHAVPFEGLTFYLKGAKWANLALRRRHRDLGDPLKTDTKRFNAMIDRYLEATSEIKQARAQDR